MRCWYRSAKMSQPASATNLANNNTTQQQRRHCSPPWVYLEGMETG